jgi:hypothetical protein
MAVIYPKSKALYMKQKHGGNISIILVQTLCHSIYVSHLHRSSSMKQNSPGIAILILPS